jgi:TetR/AcrR family transcriptional regulator
MVALKTFYNLPVEKQEIIILSALEEFALHEYESASLSNIVVRLGLAKGSFYRYFESKSSLYFFLLEHCMIKRLENDNVTIKNLSGNFSELLLEHFKAKLAFDQHYPLHSAFLYNVLHEKSIAELGNVQLHITQKMLDVIRPLIKDEQQNGGIRKNIDTDTLAFMVFQLQVMIQDYISLKCKVDFRENIRNHKKLYNLPEEELISIGKEFIKILEKGIIN